MIAFDLLEHDGDEIRKRARLDRKTARLRAGLMKGRSDEPDRYVRSDDSVLGPR